MRITQTHRRCHSTKRKTTETDTKDNGGTITPIKRERKVTKRDGELMIIKGSFKRSETRNWTFSQNRPIKTPKSQGLTKSRKSRMVSEK